MIGIYKITNPKGRVYIGQSMNIEQRKLAYSKNRSSKQPRIYNSIRKYGWGKHKFEVLNECTFEELNELEIYYIVLYDSFDTEHGLNLTEGGHFRGCVTKESIEKMRQSLLGKPSWNKGLKNIYTEETKAKMRDAKLGRKPTNAWEKGHKSWNKGRKLSEEELIKHRSINRVRPQSKEKKDAAKDRMLRDYASGKRKAFFKGKFGTNHNRSKPVIQIDKNDVLIKEWVSAREADNVLGISYKNISAVCLGNRTYAGGYKWKFN